MPNVVWVDLDELNLEAGAPVQTFDLASDLEAAGEVSEKFRPAEPLEFQRAGTAVTWKPTRSEATGPAGAPSTPRSFEQPRRAARGTPHGKGS